MPTALSSNPSRREIVMLTRKLTEENEADATVFFVLSFITSILQIFVTIQIVRKYAKKLNKVMKIVMTGFNLVMVT